MKQNPHQRTFYKNFDYILSPRSVSSKSNLNNCTHHSKSSHKSKLIYSKVDPLGQTSYGQKKQQNCFQDNNLKACVIRPSYKIDQYNFYKVPRQTLKRYDSSKLNDIGKHKKQLSRSKSVSQIHQKSRVQILGHIQKLLQDQRKPEFFQNLDTETNAKNELFRQNISTRMNRLEKYLFKIKKQRNKQIITSHKQKNIQSKPQGQNNYSFRNQGSQKQQQNTSQQRKRIANMKYLIQKLEEVKGQVMEIKNMRTSQSVSEPNYRLFNNQPAQNRSMLNQHYRYPQTSENMVNYSSHNYPSAINRFKSNMHGNQHKDINQHKYINYEQQNRKKIITGPPEMIVNPHKSINNKVKFSFGQPNYTVKSQRKVSPILILD